MQIAHEERDFNGHVTGTFASLQFRAAVKFRVEYVAGFSDELNGFSYFLTVQPPTFEPQTTDPSSDTESKLVQVFYPRATTTLCYKPWPCVCLSVCLSVCVCHKSVF